MHLRILGAHQVESPSTRLTALLVDGHLALDAGSLSRSLTLEEQGRIRAVVLTHRHFDHTRDLPTLGLATAEDGQTIELFGLPETLQDLRSHLLDGVLSADFTARPSREAPKYHLCPVTPYQEFSTVGYTLLPLPVPHSAPAVAYRLTDAEGRSLLFTGDSGTGLRQIWPGLRSRLPHLMVLEVTHANRMVAPEMARAHLTPRALQAELEAYGELYGAFPRIVATHFHPRHEAEIRLELADVSQALGVEIGIAQEDMVLEV